MIDPRLERLANLVTEAGFRQRDPLARDELAVEPGSTNRRDLSFDREIRPGCEGEPPVGRKYRSGGLGIDKWPVRRSCWNDGGGGAGVAIADLSHCGDFQAKVAANRGKPLSAPAVSGAAASASAAVPEKRRSALLDSGKSMVQRLA